LHDMGSGDQQKKTVLAILFWHIVFAQPFLVLVSVWCDLFCSSVLLEIMVRSPTKKEVTNRGCVQFRNTWGKYSCSTFVVIWQNLSNHKLIRLKRFISTFTDKLYN
jgi:hypothetical protein